MPRTSAGGSAPPGAVLAYSSARTPFLWSNAQTAITSLGDGNAERVRSEGLGGTLLVEDVDLGDG